MPSQKGGITYATSCICVEVKHFTCPEVTKIDVRRGYVIKVPVENVRVLVVDMTNFVVVEIFKSLC